MVSTRRTFISFAIACVAAEPALAQTWPSRAMRLVVPFPAGGGPDSMARLIANKLNTNTGWTIVIDNRAGAGGSIGIDAVAKSPADGHHLVIGQTVNIAVLPSLMKNLPYDPVNGLTPITTIGTSPLALVVGSTSRFKTLGDVVAFAKESPGKLNYATAGNGTVSHLTAEMLQSVAGIKLTHVPYRGSSALVNDVIGGSVELYIAAVPSVLPHVRSGKLRPLGIASAKRVKDMAQVPTFAEAGYKGVNADSWYGVFGPAGLPKEIVERLHFELTKVLNADDVKKRLSDDGVDVAISTPQAFASLVREDTAKWGKVVRDSGAKID